MENPLQTESVRLSELLTLLHESGLEDAWADWTGGGCYTVYLGEHKVREGDGIERYEFLSDTPSEWAAVAIGPFADEAPTDLGDIAVGHDGAEEAEYPETLADLVETARQLLQKLDG